MCRLLLPIILFCSLILTVTAWDIRRQISDGSNHHVSRRDANDIDYKKIIDFWTQNKKKFVFNGVYDEVVLVMGNTGAGKSTLISALIGRKLRVGMKNGYYTITDDEGRIGDGAASQTLIPEVMTDVTNNVTYIDCSGFRDNRDVEHEVSSIYLQNILMNRIKRIKFVLVINYDSVKTNGNKNDFDDLLEHVSKFIKNLHKYHDGIALVATKVENTFEEADYGTVVLKNTDEIVMKGIYDYLKSKKDIYRNKTDNYERYESSIGLIDALLKNENGPNKRISIFRQPRREGLLENLPKSKQQINGIFEMIQHLRYIEKNKDDFGFALSTSIKDTVLKIEKEIFKNALTNSLYRMGNEIIFHFTQMEKQYNDLNVLNERITKVHEDISKIKNQDNPTLIFEELVKVVNSFNISVSLTNLKKISDDIKSLQFFTTLLSDEADLFSFLQVKTHTIIESIDNLKAFYDFLIELKINLSAYNSQYLKNDYRVRSILQVQSSAVLQNVPGLETIVKEIGSDTLYETVKTLKLNTYKLDKLKSVFEAFSRHVEIACPSPSHMTVTGYNVRTKDIVEHQCWSQAKYIEIFALNKIFIECDMIKIGSEAQLHIIAPIWEVTGWSKIILNGERGKAPDKEYANRERNGSPGSPGGAAGNFYGVGRHFINPYFLGIHTDGGEGGAGQHGGNGINGVAGEQLERLTAAVNNEMIYNQDPKSLGLGYDYTHRCDSHTYAAGSFQAYATKCNCTAEFFGKPARKPTDGGNGGEGGDGGNYGTIEIVGFGDSVYKTEMITTSRKIGNRGPDGRKGLGGKKTIDGKKITIGYSCDAWFGNRMGIEKTMEGQEVPAGKDGITGENKSGKQGPKDATNLNACPTVNNFKHFVRDNLYKNIQESELEHFIRGLENDNSIKKKYTTVDYVKDLLLLESQLLDLNCKIDFIPYYDSLLARIEEFALTQYNVEHKKVLDYVYTAGLATVFRLRKKNKGESVANLSVYLKTIQNNIEELQNAQHLHTIESVQNDFDNSLRKKILEANDFILNKIEPEITKLWDETDNQMNFIVDEIKKKENDTKEALMTLHKEEAKIERMMLIRSILLPLKLAATGLSFIGPVGATVGAATTGITSLVEGMTLDTTSGLGQNKLYSLDPNLKLMSRVTEVFNNKPQQLANKLNEAVEKLDKHKEELSITQKEKIEINEKIGNFKAQLEEVKNQPVKSISEMDRRDKSVTEIEKQINDFVSKRSELLEKEKTVLEKIKPDQKDAEKIKKEKRVETCLRRFNDVQAILNGVEIAFTFMKKIENDEGAIRAIKKQISEYSEELKALEKMKGQVYDILIPSLLQVESVMNGVKASLNGSSQVTLDVTKWTVRSALGDVKLLLKKFTHKMSYELQSDIKRCMEKIDEGFSILIDVYDRIEYYSDNAKLGKHISDIVSGPLKNIVVSDPKLSNAVTDLTIIIQSNLLLEKYGLALHAFKQHYFPFAAHLLQQFQLPEDLKINDKEAIRTKIIKVIKDMQTHIGETQATINVYTKYIHQNNVFDSTTIGSEPFYVWKYDTVADEIEKLFNGREISIKANILNGLNYNAVKYTDIGINFKLDNAKLQNELNSLLSNFAITMTLVGNNYYRCGEKYYFISFDDNISITYTLTQDNSSKNPNAVYDKIKKNHAFLSPYGMWSIKLKSLNNNVTFDHLKRFVNNTMDLEMIGRGDYIEQNPDFNFDICNEYLDTFYNVETTVQGLSLV